MAESKKISFAFTKSIKKSTLKQVPQEEKKIDYIKCLDAKAIKVIGEEEKKEEPLVIPLLGTNTWHNRVINQTNADIFETKPSDKNADKQNIIIKKEPSEASNEHVTSVNKDSSSIKIKKELPDENEEKTLTLEEQAAQEIMKDLELKKEKSDLTLPLVEDTLRGVEESTLEDYEKIPVDAFGLAMLRGMGWTPGKGLGKNEKVVVPLDPVLRPKILGISKLAFHKTNEKTEQEEKELRLERASYVKIIAGRWANAYGQVEGFDQDTGRVMVKMALNNNIISVNEDLVQLVTKAEYLKNSKVLTLRLALIQLAVGDDKASNISRARSFIERAKQERADIVTLPECFNSPYGPSHFAKYAESIPDGDSCAMLSEAARNNNIYVIGGTIPERENGKLYNTCTVWAPDGKLVAKHRKLHLFDIDIKGKITFRESDSLSPGNSLTIFEAKGCKIGIGICYDIRFEELARIYRNRGCQMLIYPAAFNMTTGPLHWSLLQRSRANDNQLYVACVSPARGSPPGYVAWGHTQLTNPWAEILGELDAEEDMMVRDIDLKVVDDVRAQIPTFNQRRTDLYDTVWKKKD
ncbi:nitrilase and fragile histidine triad fusion protein NitFhit-like [Pseudomyrmex gracilis]|uniref:nitrilase and fragile histidine triad fusion protein NitFhit-like n=1 Tax=Pseudomyrmex gracilis TaxID=219809 RepID=UPI0009959D8D|nr:nitrilase and fragile histidine triad fusion protein NitFhit-like [Pseudomyrmex gracilis]